MYACKVILIHKSKNLYSISVEKLAFIAKILTCLIKHDLSMRFYIGYKISISISHIPPFLMELKYYVQVIN